MVIFSRQGQTCQGSGKYFIAHLTPLPAHQQIFELIHRGLYTFQMLYSCFTGRGKPSVRFFVLYFSVIKKNIDHQNINRIKEKAHTYTHEIPQMEICNTESVVHGQQKSDSITPHDSSQRSPQCCGLKRSYFRIK